jgi:hypothetical protein
LDIAVSQVEKISGPDKEHFKNFGRIRNLDTLFLYVFCIGFMRFPRIKVEGQSFYHCISRVVEGRFIFGTSGGGLVVAEFFVALMRSVEAYTGIRVLE